MKKKPLRIFSDSVIQYFINFNIPIPKIRNTKRRDRFELYEFCCLIQFTGKKGGFCVVTASGDFLSKLIQLILNKNVSDEDALLEALAEFSNIITGNAGRDLHSDYDILPPICNIEKIKEYLSTNQPVEMFLVDYNSSRCKVLLGLI